MRFLFYSCRQNWQISHACRLASCRREREASIRANLPAGRIGFGSFPLQEIAEKIMAMYVPNPGRPWNVNSSSATSSNSRQCTPVCPKAGESVTLVGDYSTTGVGLASNDDPPA
jgi:hypothetical protein